MKKPLHRVTDHAVLRYLERCKGIDVEGVRRELGHKVEDAVRKGATGLISEGYVFRLSPGGSLVTVYRQHSPDPRRSNSRKRRSEQ